MHNETVKFSSIFLQDEVVGFLKNSLRNQRTSQAYLFSGARSVGKAKTAKVLSATFQCLELQTDPNGFPEACGKCLSCKRILANTHPDVSTISPLGKDIRIDQVRQVQEAAILNPFLGKWRIFVFDRADRLNEFSANSLLKILEESPNRVIFFLLAENPGKILPTILSRATTVQFRVPTFHECRKTLATIFPENFENATRLFSLSEGKMGIAWRWLETEESGSEVEFLSFPETQVRLIASLQKMGEEISSYIGNSATIEELLRRISQTTLFFPLPMLAARKNFLINLLSAPKLPAGFPLLFSGLYLQTQETIKQRIKKGVDQVLQSQRQNYSSPILKEIEEGISSQLGESINSLTVSFFETAMNLLGDVFHWKCTQEEQTLLNIDRKEDIITQAKRLSLPLVQRKLEDLGTRIEAVRRFVNPLILMENFFADPGGSKY